MAMGSINVPDDESIGNETKNKGQLSLFARQKGKPLPGQSVCAGQTFCQTLLPIFLLSQLKLYFQLLSVKWDQYLPYPAEFQEDKIR